MDIKRDIWIACVQAYRRAIELEPQRLFSLVQSGLVLLALGSYTEAQELLQTALEADPEHVPALFAAAQLLLASAKRCTAQGTPGQQTPNSINAFCKLSNCRPHAWLPSRIVHVPRPLSMLRQQVDCLE